WLAGERATGPAGREGCGALALWRRIASDPWQTAHAGTRSATAATCLAACGYAVGQPTSPPCGRSRSVGGSRRTRGGGRRLIGGPGVRDAQSAGLEGRLDANQPQLGERRGLGAAWTGSGDCAAGARTREGAISGGCETG